MESSFANIFTIVPPTWPPRQLKRKTLEEIKEEALADRNKSIEIGQMGLYYDNVGESRKYCRDLYDNKIDKSFPNLLFKEALSAVG